MVFITRVTICGSPTSMPSLDVSLVAEPNFISIWLRQQLVHMISWLIMAISFTSFHYSWHNMRGSYGLPFEILMCSLHVRPLHDHYMVVLSYFSTDGGKVWYYCWCPTLAKSSATAPRLRSSFFMWSLRIMMRGGALWLCVISHENHHHYENIHTTPIFSQNLWPPYVSQFYYTYIQNITLYVIYYCIIFII